MSMTVRSKLIKIGNSRGIRIPRTLLEQAGLTDEVEMSVEGNKLVIHPVHQVREGWDAQYETMSKHGDDRLLEQEVESKFDEEDWQW